MCAIVGSFRADIFNSLFKQNLYRGSISQSLMEYDTYNNKYKLTKTDIPDNIFAQVKAHETYYLGHTQAPTGQMSGIHPSQEGSSYLWHNGILKSSYCDPGVWDTQYMHHKILENGWDELNFIDGSFACVLYKDNEFYIFRNEISPLYISRWFDVSSTLIDGYGLKPLEPNVVFRMNFKLYTKEPLVPHFKFKTVNNPYWMP